MKWGHRTLNACLNKNVLRDALKELQSLVEDGCTEENCSRPRDWHKQTNKHSPSLIPLALNRKCKTHTLLHTLSLRYTSIYLKPFTMWNGDKILKIRHEPISGKITIVTAF